MSAYKRRCPLCKKMFLVDNGNKKYCYDCKPNDKKEKKEKKEVKENGM